MKMMRLISLAMATCCLSGAAAQAQLQEQIQVDPNILTERPVFVPDLKLRVFDLPDLGITELRGPDTGPDQAGNLELIVNLQNFGESPTSLKFLDKDGQVQPTFEVMYEAPSQSLGALIDGTGTGDQLPVVKQVFLDAVLGPGQRLSRTEAGYNQQANLMSISLRDFRDKHAALTGVHRLVVILDPAETLIERSRRNNMAAFRWVEDSEAVSMQEPRERLRLTIPTKEPVKQNSPELRPFE